MRVMVLGKTGGITHWIEDLVGDLRLDGHDTQVVPTRNPWLSKGLERALLSPSFGAPLATLTVRRMRRFAPALMLAAGALDQFPLDLFEPLSAAPRRPPLIAWIGDAFDERQRRIAELFDLVAYTDTGMLARHQDLGFASAAAFVPLGATRAATVPDMQRMPRLAFVAAPTDNRRALLASVRTPIAIFGPGWQEASELAHHERVARRVMAGELARIYASHLGVLNIRHGLYVINGLNQRHFAPYMQGTPVVTDAQPDIPHCFDEGTEMLVWRDAAELDALCERMRIDPAWAASVGAAGQRRVLAQHTYGQRLISLARLAGVKTAQQD